MWPLAVRTVLDSCETVGEAVEYLESVPHARNVNVPVVDAAGDVAVVEASPAAVETRRPADGDAVLVATNQFHTPEMADHQSLDRRPADCERYRAVASWAEGRGSVGSADLRTLIGDPDGDIAWSLDEAGEDPRSTIWSWVIDTAGDAWHAPDSPAEVTYETVTWPASDD